MSRKLLVWIIFLVFLSGTAFSINITGIDTGIEQTSDEVSSFLTGIPRDDFVIVTGRRISLEDQILFNMLRSGVKDIQSVEIRPDRDFDSYNKTLVLIGGEKTNYVTKALLSENRIKNLSSSTHSPLIMGYAVLDNDRRALIIYSEKEIYNRGNSAPSKSPLAGIMDRELIPVSVTLAAMLLLYLWDAIAKIISKVFTSILTSKATGYAKKDRTVSERKKIQGAKLHEYMMPNELIALGLSILVFALTMSWTWSKDMNEFWGIFFINLLVVGVISALREFLRQALCHRQKIRTEYVFWPLGTMITLASTFLGNTFSIVSFTITDKSTESEKKSGKQSFLLFLAGVSVAAIAYVINIIMPSLVLQMIFVYCIMSEFISLFPFEPFSGRGIRKWNPRAWLFGYVIITLAYIRIIFSVYV